MLRAGPGGDGVAHAVRGVLVQQPSGEPGVPRGAGEQLPGGPSGRLEFMGERGVERGDGVEVRGAERLGGQGVERGGPLVEVTGRLEGAAGASVAHDQERDPVGAAGEGASGLLAVARSRGLQEGEPFGRSARPAGPAEQPGAHREGLRQRAPGRRVPIGCMAERHVEVHADAPEGAVRPGWVGRGRAVFARPHDDEEVRARGGEHPHGVEARVTRGVELGGGPGGDLGHQERRTGAHGGGDKHAGQRTCRAPPTEPGAVSRCRRPGPWRPGAGPGRRCRGGPASPRRAWRRPPWCASPRRRRRGWTVRRAACPRRAGGAGRRR